MTQRRKEFVLTLVQHTHCSDCALLKNRIADVYITSGLNRGEDSKYWRVNIFSPPWDREARVAEFPTGFRDVDVPALKLEIDGRAVATTQAPNIISTILTDLKEMLMKRASNEDLAAHVETLVKTMRASAIPDQCAVGSL